MKQSILPGLVALILLYAGCGSEFGKQEALSEKSRAGIAQQEDSLVTLFRLLSERNNDLPYEYADTFRLRLAALLEDSATFHHPFDSLIAGGISIIESDDKCARIYWWLHPHSGTFRHFPAIVQYRDRSGVHRVEDLGPEDGNNAYAATAYSSLHHLADSTYLTIGVGQIWQGGNFEVIAPMVLTDSGVIASDFAFHFGDSIYPSIRLDKNWYFDHMEQFEYTIPLISTYDSASRILTFPAIVDIETGEIYNDVLAEEEIQPSGDTVRLRFNGRFFEEI